MLFRGSEVQPSKIITNSQKKKVGEPFETRANRCYNGVKTAQKGSNRVASSGGGSGGNFFRDG
jgi:hypothetical protein